MSKHRDILIKYDGIRAFLFCFFGCPCRRERRRPCGNFCHSERSLTLATSKA